MKPFTKEQFEIIKDWVWAARLNCTHDAMHSIEQHAYDLLVNDSEPEKTPPSDVNPFFPYLESQDLKTHWNNPVDTVITSSEEPISWNGLKIYNPETHMLVPRVWSEEVNSEGEQAGIHLTNALGLELNGKYHPVYNPETNMLVPRVWSEEQKKLINVLLCNRYVEREGSSTNSDDILYAITKVFGGEK